MDLIVHNTVMLIKFSKQIANSFAKIINGNNQWRIQKPVKNLRWTFFHEVVTGFRKGSEYKLKMFHF